MQNKILFLFRVLMGFIFAMSARALNIKIMPGQVIPMNRHERRTVAAVRRRDAEAPINLTAQRAWFAPSTVTSMNGLFNGIYEDAIFVAREENLMAQLVTPYGASGYATRTLPIYPSLTATEVGEGVDYNNATEWTKASEAVFTPKEIMNQVILTDRRIQTDPDSARSDAGVEMGGAIATKIDTDLVALFDNFDTSVGTAGSALTLSNVAAGIAILQANKVRGAKSVVIHPFQWHPIWVALGQPSANQSFLGDLANQAMREYGVARMVNADWYTSANITSGTAAKGGVMSREALALDTREAPSMEAERDASLRAWELNMHAGYAVGVRRSDYGVELLSDASQPS